MQWSAFRHDNLRFSDPPISTGHSSTFGITAEWLKITQNCCHTGLAMFICICGSAAVSLSQLIIRENVRNLRRHYKKSKSEPLTDRSRPLISLHQFLPTTKIYVKKKKKKKKKNFFLHAWSHIMNIHFTIFSSIF